MWFLLLIQTFLEILFHNENDADEIQKAIQCLHKYVPFYGEDDERVYASHGVVADQLSVERGVNAFYEISNGFTPEERLEGLHLEIADWHAGNKFLKVRCTFLYPVWHKQHSVLFPQDDNQWFNIVVQHGGSTLALT